MDLPKGYAFRTPTEDDADAVGDVLLADQRADGVEPTLDASFVRQAWSRPDLELAADAWVVMDRAGAIVAYGQASLDEPSVVGSWGVVHPEHRRRASARRCSTGSRHVQRCCSPARPHPGSGTRSTAPTPRLQRWPAPAASG
jgi:hypothetical protein